MLPQLGLLPPLGHKEAIGTLGYPHSLKTGGLVTFVHCIVHRQTNTGLYNIGSCHPPTLVRDLPAVEI